MVLLRCTALYSIHGRNSAPTSVTIRRLSAAPFRTCTTLLPDSSVFPAPKLTHSGRRHGAITGRSPRAAASVEADLKDAKPQLSWHSLPSGLRLEVLSIEVDGEGKAPLVFVHGSYHGAWCWAVHFLPFFASLGYDCYAVSLLGQGASDAPSEPGTIQSHARDIAHFVSQRCGKRPPVLIGHSFGGLIVQYYLSQVSTSGECTYF